MIDDATLQYLSLDFTLPGYEIELMVSLQLQSRIAPDIDFANQPGGADIPVGHRNVHRYTLTVCLTLCLWKASASS